MDEALGIVELESQQHRVVGTAEEGQALSGEQRKVRRGASLWTCWRPAQHGVGMVGKDQAMSVLGVEPCLRCCTLWRLVAARCVNAWGCPFCVTLCSACPSPWRW